jgi:hypothetical protein
VADDNIVLGGSGATRSLTILRPAGIVGKTTITVSVSDGTGTTTSSFIADFPERIDYYLAEGATGPFFHTDILLSCPFSGSEGLNTTVSQGPAPDDHRRTDSRPRIRIVLDRRRGIAGRPW